MFNFSIWERVKLLSKWKLRRVILSVIIIIVVYLLISFRYKSSIQFSNESYEKNLKEISEKVVVDLEFIMKGEAVELAQDDLRIKNYILSHGYLLKPSELAYNLTKPFEDPSMGQGQMVRKILQNMTNGFFVECGGLDGETRSNTLFLEKQLGWKGLVIEADPKNFQLLRMKQRKSWISNSCLATRPIPHEVIFQPYFNIGKILMSSAKSFNATRMNNMIRVECFPLFSLLNALNVTTVDYFSLDVEGSELQVLQNIPFDKLFIKILSVEFSHVPEGKDNLLKFMKSKGYILVGNVTAAGGRANDFIFTHQNSQGNITKSLE